MSNTSKKVVSLALILTTVFLILCTGFYTFELLSGYSPSSGQFEKGIFSDVFLPLIYMLALVAFAMFGFLFRTSLTGRTYKNVLSVLFASGFGALVTLFWLISLLADFFSELHTGPSMIFGVLLILSAIAAVAYFVLCATPTPSHTYAVVLGMGAALFMLAYAFYAYFDSTFALNSPIKLLDQISAIALAIFFLTETRFRFGAVTEAVFFPVGMAAFLLSASNGIGAIIYFLAEERPLVVDTMHDFLFLGLSLYVLARLISFLLPSLFREEATAESAGSAAFETEGGATHAEQADLAQETFDFDNAPAPSVLNEETVSEPDASSAEVSQEFDTPTET